MKKIVSAIAFLFVLTNLFAQSEAGKYKTVDEATEKLGPLLTLNVATIADTITMRLDDNEQKARAIFYWIANNIALDPKAVKQNDDKNTLPEKVIETRKTTSLGFSLLVQEMCSDANIRCISVDGYVKEYADQINQAPDEKNHSWNVVQLGQSPETWYYVDASRASGSVDKRFTAFTKDFTSAYFFADKPFFNLAYFPDNKAWQLGGSNNINTVKEYYTLPVINNAAFALGLRKPTPLIGYIKTSLKKPVAFSFPASGDIKKISLVAGDEKRNPKPEEMNFTNTGGVITFSYTFKKEDTFPLRVVADGKDILQYMVEVTE